jgi:hypothetical protein
MNADHLGETTRETHCNKDNIIDAKRQAIAIPTSWLLLLKRNAEYALTVLCDDSEENEPKKNQEGIK